MEKRKNSIELMRFVAALMVAAFHYNAVCYHGQGGMVLYPLAVEFFLMVSGYFVMKEVSEPRSDKPLLPANGALGYAFSKWKAIWGICLVAELIMFVIRTLTKDTFRLGETMQEFFHFKWEFLLLHMLGFNQAPAFGKDYLLAPVWYLSSMLIAMVPVYFLAQRLGRTFSHLIAPLSAMLIYAYEIQTYGTLNVGNELVGPMLLGNLRAFAGLCVGALAYQCGADLSHVKHPEQITKVLSVLDVAAWGMMVVLLVLPAGAIPAADGVLWVFFFAVLLINGTKDIGPVTHWLNRHGGRLTAILGSLSLYIFLFHWQILMLMGHYLPTDHNPALVAMFFALTLGVGIVAMVLHGTIRRRK